jgi:hypothetical protein
LINAGIETIYVFPYWFFKSKFESPRLNKQIKSIDVRKIVLSFLTLLLASIVFCQSNEYTVSVFGTVKDAAGKAVPGATIVIKLLSLTNNTVIHEEKLQTGPLGGYEFKKSIPATVQLGVAYVILYDCNGKEVGQKVEFKAGAANKFELNFKYCANAIDPACGVSIVELLTPNSQFITLKAEPRGKAPFSFSWNNGSKEQTVRISPVPGTSICVEVTDAESCKAKACFNFPLPPKCAVYIKQTASGELFAQVEGKAPYEFEWLPTNETTQGILPKVPGDYCVYVVTADKCEAKACFKVAGPPPACQVEISATALSGVEGWLLKAIPRGEAPFKYYWSNSNTEGTQSVTVVKPGEYCVTVLDAKGCKSFACKKVGLESICRVVIEPTKDPSGKIVKLSAITTVANVKYIWSNGKVTPAIEPQGSGKYCVTISDDRECKAYACFEIPTLAKCAVSIAQTSSGELVANTQGVEPFKYKWIPNGEITKSIKPSAPVEYCVYIVTADNCEAKACYKIVPPEAKCGVEIGAQRLGNVGGWVLKAHARGLPPFKYYWSNQKEGVDSIIVNKSGEYCVTIVDAAGCKNFSCKKVEDLWDPCRVIIEPGKDASGKIVKLSAVTAVANVKYYWSNMKETQSIEVTEPGRYCVTITDGQNCKAFACFEVPGVRKCAVVIKPLASGELLAEAEGSGNFKFSWSTGETTRAILPKTPGAYCVKVIFENGCIASACFQVLGKDQKCAAEIKGEPLNTTPQSWKLTAAGRGTEPFKYLWSQDNATGQSITVTKAGNYCVTVTDVVGCTAKACKTVGLEVLCNVAIEVLKDPASTVVILKAAVSANDYTFKWNTGETTPFIIPTISQEYCVTATNASGCKAFACFKFETKLSNLSQTIEGFVNVPTITTAIVKLKGKATLYYLNQPTASSVQVLQVPLQLSKDGKPNFYSFGKLPAGRYLVRISLDSDDPLSKEFLPTYYGDVIQWNASSVIPVPHAGGFFNVTLVKANNEQGPGNITGFVNKGNGLTTGEGAIRGGNPVTDATMLLIDMDDNPISFVQTNERGEFAFRNLAYGTYKVMVDRVGMEPEWNWVTLTALNPQVNNLNFSVPESALTSSENANAAVQGLHAFPNPVSDKVMLRIESATTQESIVKMTSITGRSVYQEKLMLIGGMQQHQVDMSALPSGLYFIQITNGQRISTVKVVKE